ncbi:MAG: hypothetical protein LBS19_05815 [Clostridiales bacterium]|jgi:hypothetical protein|nr:hypothetical protein [Clostridiales bacterium]
MSDYADILDRAMYMKSIVRITTKEKGVITGMPVGVDEYDTDEDRLGYYIIISHGEMDTVYLNDVIEVIVNSDSNVKEKSAV